MAAGLTRADVRSALLWFAGALALYLATGARGLVWADSSKLTLYALAGYFPSLNPGDHAGWTVLAWAWLHLVGGDPVVAAHRLSAVCRRAGGGAGDAGVAPAAATASGRTRRPRCSSSALPGLVGRDRGRDVRAGARARPRRRLGADCAADGGGAGCWPARSRGLRPGRPRDGRVPRRAARPGSRLGAKAWRLLPGAAVGLAPVWLAVFGSPLDPLTGFAASGVSTWRWHWGAFVALRPRPSQCRRLRRVCSYTGSVLWGRRAAAPARHACTAAGRSACCPLAALAPRLFRRTAST